MFQCVYSIQCLDPEIKEFYIGSTDNFKRRVKSHKVRYNNGCHYKVYKFIRENGGISNWEINPIEIFSFLTEEELRQHEQFYLDEYKPELNCLRAIGLTPTEYYEENKETIKERLKNYREKNKEKIAKYYEKNKEKILLNCKEYREKNKEIILLKKKEYYQKKKEKLKEKINCKVCNKLICKYGMKRHIKTQHPNP